jgi:plastocyanin
MTGVRSFRLRIGLGMVLLAGLFQFATSSPVYAAAPHTWHAVVGAEAADDAIQVMAFLPGALWVNVGDTVVWTVKAGEIHTVTFLAIGQSLPTFNPGDPNQLFPHGGSHYDGKTYHNSGILSDEGAASGFPAHGSYQLTFDVPGDYTYFCLVHGTMMQGLIHVRPAGTLYPFTQTQYDTQIRHLRAALIRHGRALWEQAEDQATSHLILAGMDDGLVSVMRWVRSDVTVHVGDTITFANRGLAEPHTVTFGPDQGNIFAPYGDPTHFTGQPLNSGFFLPGATFRVTFLKAGTFAFHCALHDYLGMVGTIHVVANDDDDD